MPPHVKWPRIVSFHNVRKTVNQYPELTNGDSKVVYRSKIKLHGTNSAIQFHDGVPYAQSRTQVLGSAEDLEKGNDNAGFRRFLHQHKKALVAQAEAFKDTGTTMTVFGEWAGCLEHSTKILLADGTTKSIGKIVNNKLEAEVLSYNLETQRFEPKKIIGWLKRNDANNWLTIDIKRRKRGGKEHRLVITDNHIVFVKRNGSIQEVPAGDLKVGDILLTPGKRVSYHQIQFMMGSLLGDSSFNSYGHFVTGHSEKSQKDYLDFIQRLLKEIVSNVTSKLSGYGSSMTQISTVYYKLPECLRNISKINWVSQTPMSGLIETPIISIKKGNPYSENWRKARYDIEVEDNHNFIANGMLVHNSGIQKGCAIHKVDKPIFAVFAMIESDTEFEGQTRIWTEPSVISLALSFLLDQVPEMHILPWETEEMTVDWTDSTEKLQSVVDVLNKEVERVEACDPWVKKTFGIEGVGEGLVYYPVSSRHNSRDDFSNLGFKAKGDKHRVVKTKKAVQVDPEVAASMLAFADLVCTEARLEQGVTEACNGEYSQKKIGPFIGWVASDIRKECEAELQAAGLKWKPTAKVVTNYARSWYLKKIETT